MRPNPLVTILTPCYNHEEYLDEYFQGLLAQTYENIQLILIDDGSTDCSWEKICSYEARLNAKFPAVILDQHENIGGAKEIIRGFNRVEGELFCILESDDYYLPTKIEQNVRYLQQYPDVGAVHSEIDYIYGERIERRHWQKVGRRIPSGDILDALLLDNFIMTCSFCCRTDLFRRYVDQREYLSKGYIAIDYALFLDLARHTQFGYINKSLARYRVLRNSYIHSSDLSRAFNIEKNYQQIKLDYIEKYGGSNRARSLAIEGMYQADFLFGFRMSRVEQCLDAYAWLMRHNPDRYGALPFRVLAASVRNRYLRKLMQWVVDIRVVQRLTLRHFRLRNRGAALM